MQFRLHKLTSKWLVLTVLLVAQLPSIGRADVVKEANCLHKTNIPLGNIQQLVEVTKKSKYLLMREEKLKRNREQIKKLLSKKNIIGLELIVAGPRDDKMASRWGHAMIRFVDNDGDWRNDYVVSFVLDQNEDDMSMAKAIFGGYPVIPETKTFGEFWGHYAAGEGRSLERILLNADKQQIKKLLLTLQDRAEHPKKLGSYTFASNNCANVLEKVLKDAGFPQSTTTRFPTHLKDWAHKSTLSLYPSIKIVPPKATLEKAAKVLGITYQQLMDGENYPPNTKDKLKDFSVKEKYVLAYNVDLLPDEVMDTLSEELKGNQLSVDQVYGFDPIAQSLYQLCSDKNCIEQNDRFADKFWGKQKMDKVRHQRLQQYFDITYDEVPGASFFGETTDEGEIPGIDHPWFNIKQWQKRKHPPHWLKKNNKFLTNLEQAVLSDAKARKILDR